MQLPLPEDEAEVPCPARDSAVWLAVSAIWHEKQLKLSGQNRSQWAEPPDASDTLKAILLTDLIATPNQRTEIYSRFDERNSHPY